MATAIRLKRGGRTHAPYYRIVVTDSRRGSGGRVIEEIGVYHPCARPEPVTEVNVRKALEWLYKGARPSTTTRNILSKAGVLAMHAAGKKPEEVAAAAAPANVEDTPAPAEDTAAEETKAAEETAPVEPEPVEQTAGE